MPAQSRSVMIDSFPGHKILMFASNDGAAESPCSADTFDLLSLFSHSMSADFLLHSQPAIDPTQAQIRYIALDYSRFAEDNLLNWLPEVANLLSWFQDLKDGIIICLTELPTYRVLYFQGLIYRIYGIEIRERQTLSFCLRLEMKSTSISFLSISH